LLLLLLLRKQLSRKLLSHNELLPKLANKKTKKKEREETFAKGCKNMYKNKNIYINEGAIMLHDIESRVIMWKNVDLATRQHHTKYNLRLLFLSLSLSSTLRNEKELHCSLC
jgi:hypothetical protein